MRGNGDGPRRLEDFQRCKERSAGRRRCHQPSGRARCGRGGGRRENDRCSRALTPTVLAASIPLEQIAIVALFHTIQNAVTTTWKGTIHAAERIGSIGILQTGITLFPEINNPVAAVSECEAAVRSASVRQRRIVESGFTLLLLCGLHDAVSADTTLIEAVCRTAVEVPTVAVITFFPCIEYAVATRVLREQQ